MTTAVRPLSELLDIEAPAPPWYHFSIDDMFDVLIEVTDKNMPLFQHPLMALLKEMHDRYGMHVDLELFYQKEIDGFVRTLKEVRSLREELLAAGDWIHFGPHALDYQTAPFEQSPEDQKKVFDDIYREIDRFAGSDMHGQWVRLHFYSESFELGEYFRGHGVTALLSTDRAAGSHRMSDEVKKLLPEQGCAQFQGTNFIRTQFRVEEFTNTRLTEEAIEKLFKDAIERFGYIIIYSHEYEYARAEVRAMMRRTMAMLHKLNIPSIKNP